MAKLHFYYSAMNAGKTTTLLQSSYNYRERGLTTILFKPEMDDRDGRGHIASRIGLKADAIEFSRDFDFYTYMSDYCASHDKPACVLVDEAQFLTREQVHQLGDVVDRLNIPILCYGLRTDFLGEPFEGSKYLLAIAEELTEIKTICHCGRKAIMNVRVDDQGRPTRKGDQFLIGGNDRYIATCRRHYNDGDLKFMPLDLDEDRAVS